MPHMGHRKVGIGRERVAEGEHAAARVGEAGRPKDVVGGRAASDRATERYGAGEIGSGAVVVILGRQGDGKWAATELGRGNRAPDKMIEKAPRGRHVEWVAQSSVAIAVIGTQNEVGPRLLDGDAAVPNSIDEAAGIGGADLRRRFGADRITEIYKPPSGRANSRWESIAGCLITLVNCPVWEDPRQVVSP